MQLADLSLDGFCWKNPVPMDRSSSLFQAVVQLSCQSNFRGTDYKQAKCWACVKPLCLIRSCSKYFESWILFWDWAASVSCADKALCQGILAAVPAWLAAEQLDLMCCGVMLPKVYQATAVVKQPQGFCQSHLPRQALHHLLSTCWWKISSASHWVLECCGESKKQSKKTSKQKKKQTTKKNHLWLLWCPLDLLQAHSTVWKSFRWEMSLCRISGYLEIALFTISILAPQKSSNRAKLVCSSEIPSSPRSLFVGLMLSV